MLMVKLLWGKHLSYVFNTINYGLNVWSLSYHFTKLPRPITKTPVSGSWNLEFFGRPFLGHNYYILNYSNIFQELERRWCLKNASIFNFLHKNNIFWGREHAIYNFLSLATSRHRHHAHSFVIRANWYITSIHWTC